MEEFKREKELLKDNFTKMSNFILDNIHLFSPAEYMVASVIIRKTEGWNKSWDRISFSQISKATRLGRETVRRSINKLLEKGFISRDEGKKRSPETGQRERLQRYKKKAYPGMATIKKMAGG